MTTDSRGFVLALDSDSNTGKLATLCVKSIRKWGGRLENAPIYIIDCGFFDNQREHFERLGCIIKPLPFEYQVKLPLQYGHEQKAANSMAGLVYTFALDVPETLMQLGADCLVIGDVSDAFEQAENNWHGIASGKVEIDDNIYLHNWKIFCRNDKPVDEWFLEAQTDEGNWGKVPVVNSGSVTTTNLFRRDKGVKAFTYIHLWSYADWLDKIKTFGMDQWVLSAVCKGIKPGQVNDLDNCHRLVAHTGGLAHDFNTHEVTMEGQPIRLLHLSGPTKPWSPGADVIPITQAYLQKAQELH